jgi:hypothetical protein
MAHLELIARCENHAPALRHGYSPVGLPEDVEASPTNGDLDYPLVNIQKAIEPFIVSLPIKNRDFS